MAKTDTPKVEAPAAPEVNLEQAAAEIGNLTRMFRALRDVENVINTLRGAKQLQAETEQAITTAKRKLTVVTKDIDEAKAEAARIRDEATFERTAAVADRERIIVDTQNECSAMLERAKEQHAAADAELAAKTRDLDGLVQKAGIIRGEVDRLEAQRAAVLAALTGAQSSVTSAPGD
jgi:chromosome segregation ATPase